MPVTKPCADSCSNNPGDGRRGIVRSWWLAVHSILPISVCSKSPHTPLHCGKNKQTFRNAQATQCVMLIMAHPPVAVILLLLPFHTNIAVGTICLKGLFVLIFGEHDPYIYSV